MMKGIRGNITPTDDILSIEQLKMSGLLRDGPQTDIRHATDYMQMQRYNNELLYAQPQTHQIPQIPSAIKQTGRYQVVDDQTSTNGLTCVQIHEHIKTCPVCSKLYVGDKSIHTIIIIILIVIVIILLKKLIEK